MPNAALPTKANLISAKRNLSLAKKGFDVLRRKHTVLMREMMLLIEQAAELQNDIGGTFSSAYSNLQMANVTMGISTTLKSHTPEESGFRVSRRNVMGVELPSTSHEQSPPRPFYGFSSTNHYMDATYTQFTQVKELCARLAGIENSIYRLAQAIKKNQRRANTLEYVVVPRYQGYVHTISATLEEQEREAFSRLKLIKRTKSEKRVQG